MRKKMGLLSLVVGFLWMTPLLGENIQILALFKDKALLEIEGNTHLLKVGEEIKGIKLLEANSKQCVLDINGQRQVFNLGSQVNINFAPAKTPTVQITHDERGLYHTQGKVNGKPVDFIIDTGASIVALSAKKAKELDIPFNEEKKITVQTASGHTQGYLTKLHEISIGQIKVYDVQAVILESEGLKDILLGRSFLQRVEISERAYGLELRQKY